MMWGVALIFVSCVAAQVASHEIKAECHKFEDFPPVKENSPSLLADLKLELVTVEEEYKINISWAINIDGSIEYLTGTRILTRHSEYHCGYNPPLYPADFPESKLWFHYVVSARTGLHTIQVSNLPLPQLGGGPSYKVADILVPDKPRVTPETIEVPTPQRTAGEPQQDLTTTMKSSTVSGTVNFTSIAVAIFGGLASLMILSSCYIIYKRCGANFATSLGFKMLPTSSKDPVAVLVVYPAENLAFQRAVVALAEFLQWHGGCSVAVDMWQQGKIAELGPMRWLAEQAKAADRVLIVCPQPIRLSDDKRVDENHDIWKKKPKTLQQAQDHSKDFAVSLTPSSMPSNSLLSHGLPEPSIPAAAHDLYPLILNMVASHAKSASDLAKFWVVQLGEQQDKRPSNLPLELRACKTFCLMKDLNKLCKGLHTQRQNGKKISDLIFRPGIDKSAVKLKEAVEDLGGHQPSIFREVEPLKSVVTTI